MNPRLHRLILLRDRECVAYKFDRQHVCRDRWGNVHWPNDLDRLTVDHVHQHAGGTKGKRALDDPHHLVAMCYWQNSTHPPSHDLRQFERAYLIDINQRYPIPWPSTGSS